MNTFCAACAKGPVGPAGHDALRAFSMGKDGLSLQCDSCQSFWQRTSDSRRGFAWSAFDDRAALNPSMGVSIPGRTDAPGRPLQGGKDPDFDRFVAAVLGKAFAKGRDRTRG